MPARTTCRKAEGRRPRPPVPSRRERRKARRATPLFARRSWCRPPAAHVSAFPALPALGPRRSFPPRQLRGPAPRSLPPLLSAAGRPPLSLLGSAAGPPFLSLSARSSPSPAGGRQGRRERAPGGGPGGQDVRRGLGGGGGHGLPAAAAVLPAEAPSPHAADAGGRRPSRRLGRRPITEGHPAGGPPRLAGRQASQPAGPAAPAPRGARAADALRPLVAAATQRAPSWQVRRGQPAQPLHAARRRGPQLSYGECGPRGGGHGPVPPQEAARPCRARGGAGRETALCLFLGSVCASEGESPGTAATGRGAALPGGF